MHEYFANYMMLYKLCGLVLQYKITSVNSFQNRCVEIYEHIR